MTMTSFNYVNRRFGAWVCQSGALEQFSASWQAA